MKNIFIYFVLSLFIVLQVTAQEYWERRFKTYQNPDELVTMSETLPFSQAIELLSKVSESITGRRIVSTVQRKEPIGIEILNMPYDKALQMIVNFAGLEYEMKEDVIVIHSKDDKDAVKDHETYAAPTEREVKISAVFCEIDVVEARKIGFFCREVRQILLVTYVLRQKEAQMTRVVAALNKQGFNRSLNSVLTPISSLVTFLDRQQLYLSFLMKQGLEMLFLIQV